MRKLYRYHNVILFGLIILVMTFISVGYASYGQLLTLNGNVSVLKRTILEITNVTQSSSSYLKTSSTPSYSINTVTFGATFSGGTSSSVAYLITITNNSNTTYTYTSTTFTSTAKASSGTASVTSTVSGITNGTTIAAGATTTMTITYKITQSKKTATATLASTAVINFTKNNTGSLLASVTPASGNLQSPNTSTSFTVSVMNTYSYDREFTLSLGNTNFNITNTSSYTIAANTTQSFPINISTGSGAVFLSNSETSSLILSSSGINNVNVGTLTFAVDIYSEPDTAIPEIGPVTMAISDTTGQFEVDWTRLDSGGTSMTSYTVMLYNSSDTLINTVTVNPSLTSYTFTGIDAGTYYAKVYGTDAAGNTGSSYVSTSTTDSTYCRKSANYTMKWVFSVTNSLSNLTSNGASTANLNSTYSATLTASTNYTLPSSITVTMGGTTLTSGTGYTYSSSSGAISIPSVNGDITITASGTSSCLVKGTKITLADGTTKNIEDIGYDDLLLVWNYETGSFTYEYPIWIEKTATAAQYSLITFSDGTTLKVVGKHGLFDTSDDLFISTIDGNFKVGTSVAKYNFKTNKFESIKVVSIEQKYDTVNYYHVVSTRYYNIIANGVLTTDGTVSLSNLYGFTSNITWPSYRNSIISNPDNLYDYSDLSDIIPYYMFLGTRMEEGKYLEKIGNFSTAQFKKYLAENQVNQKMILSPITNSSGTRLWMVTTSDDQVLGSNKNMYLVKEGSYYKLPTPKTNNGKTFIGWYNTADGKYYQANEIVQIYTGTHFVATYSN